MVPCSFLSRPMPWEDATPILTCFTCKSGQTFTHVLGSGVPKSMFVGSGSITKFGRMTTTKYQRNSRRIQWDRSRGLQHRFPERKVWIVYSAFEVFWPQGGGFPGTVQCHAMFSARGCSNAWVRVGQEQLTPNIASIVGLTFDSFNNYLFSYIYICCFYHMLIGFGIWVAGVYTYIIRCRYSAHNLMLFYISYVV